MPLYWGRTIPQNPCKSVTNVLRGVNRNAKAPALQLLQLPDVAASGPPDRICILHHRTDELVVQQHEVPDGQAGSPVEEGARRTSFELPSFLPRWDVPPRSALYQASPRRPY